jgi:hypothetical protein
MNDNIQLIRQKCIAANPDCKGKMVMGGNSPIFINRPVRRADVLLPQDKVLPFRKGYVRKMTDTVLK